MPEPEKLLAHIRDLAAALADRKQRAEQIAGAIRDHGGYRWVGLYDVDATSVSIISWSGASSGQSAPAFPVFPVTKGLTSAAIREKKPVLVGDVRNDPRYLTAFGNTLSEMILPVLHPKTGAVIGTVDVESERANAFTAQHQQLLEDCVKAALLLWTEHSR